jgi:hypothetical protein
MSIEKRTVVHNFHAQLNSVLRMLCAVTLGLAPATRGLADTVATISGTAQYQHNSNVFDLQSGQSVPGILGAPRGDSDYAYGSAFQLNDLLGQQKLFLNLTGTEFRYDRYTELNHSEYNLDGGLNWKLGTKLDGKLEVVRTRTMVAFFNLVPGTEAQSNLAIQTEQREAGQVGLLVNPDFRIEGNAYHRVVDEPLDGNPNLQLTETFGQAALKYIGRAGLTSGLSVGYLSGAYTNSSTAEPSYRQINYDLIANYQATGRSSLAGEIGYSQRTSAAGTDNVSGITGNIAYRSQLTGKTSIDLVLNRGINSYIANSGSEIDTTAALDVNWQITYKIGLAVGYSFTDSNLLNQGNITNTNRVDHLQYASLKLDYKVFRWLSIKPYANTQTRKSDVAAANFNATIYGIYFTVQSFK